MDVETRLDAKTRIIRGMLYLAAMMAVCLTCIAVTGSILESLHTVPTETSR